MPSWPTASFEPRMTLINLIKLSAVDLNAPEYRDSILKHGPEKLYAKLQLAAGE